MEKMQHLAIASVPVQTWNQVYDAEQAFKNGTLFPELTKPFYVTAADDGAANAKAELTPQEAMLRQIQQTGFVVDDLRLYMDTHPEDQEGLKLLKAMLRQKKTLMKEFALQFYPLTEKCMELIYEEKPDSDCYCWAEGRIPWEGACS